jgi:hypothetical protein
MGTEADAIATGQRQIVMQAIYAGVRYGSFDRRTENGVIYIRDLTIGKRPHNYTDIDELVECLKRQLAFWDRAKKHLPHGDARALILDGDPVGDITNTLRRNGRL